MVHPLLSPEQSQQLVLVASIVVAILGAALGFAFKGARGLLASLCGPFVFGLWLLHGALVARFGMDSLALLVGESTVFIALGAVLGRVWNRLGARNTEKN
jgi:uncharacterized membrane protein (Fun14 family)